MELTGRAAEVIAIVPARGGSKSLPRKNVRRLAGFPLVAWSIAAARASRRVSRVIVSTDDPEIRDVALASGAEVPFLRPADLARDDTLDLPVFVHALEWLDRVEGYRPDLVVHLRPTSPLRPAGLVDEAVAQLASRPDADSLRAVCPAPQTPYKMWRASGGYLAPLLSDAPKEAYNRPRQSLPPVFWQTGHLDAMWRETILVRRSMTGERILPLVVDTAYAVDIDTEVQWAFAEWLAGRGGLDLARPRRHRKFPRPSRCRHPHGSYCP